MTLANRVRELTLTTGTGDITLGGALPAHIAFADAFAVGDTVTYVIEDGDNYEIGTGTLQGTTTFQRTSVGETLVAGVYTKSSPAPIALSGNARIYCAVTAGIMLDPDLQAEVISEVTPGAGVTVDGVLLKDGSVIGADSDIMTIAGGTGIASGSNIQLFGESHATQAGDTVFRSNSVPWLSWDNSAGATTFAGSVTVENNEFTKARFRRGGKEVSWGMHSSDGTLVLTSDGGAQTSFDDAGNATFAGNLDVESNSVTVGALSGAATGAFLELNGWDGAAIVNNRILGLGSAGGGMRFDVGGAVGVMNLTNGTLDLSGPANTTRQINLQTSGVDRWRIGATSVSEGGANVGSDYGIARFDDAGTLIDTPFSINRASGLITMAAELAVQGTGQEARIRINNTGTGDSVLRHQLDGLTRFVSGPDRNDGNKVKFAPSNIGADDFLIFDPADLSSKFGGPLTTQSQYKLTGSGANLGTNGTFAINGFAPGAIGIGSTSNVPFVLGANSLSVVTLGTDRSASLAGDLLLGGNKVIGVSEYRQSDNTGVTQISGGDATNVGANMQLYSGNHPNTALRNNLYLRSDGTIRAFWNNQSNHWDYQGNDVVGIGNLVLSGDFYRGVSGGQLNMAGGSTAIEGARLVLRGELHAEAYDAIFRAGTLETLRYQHLNTLWDFQDNDINVGGSLNVGGNARISISAIPGTPGDDPSGTSLRIDRNSNNSIQINSGNSNLGQVRFGDGDGSYRGAVSYSHATDTLSLVASGQEFLTGDGATGATTVLGQVNLGNNNIVRSNSNNAVYISGSTAPNVGPNLYLIGENNPAQPNNIGFRVGVDTKLLWNDAANYWNYNNKTVVGVSEYRQSNNTGFSQFSGGDATNAGANMQLYGGNHSLLANDIYLRTDGDIRLSWNNSAAYWDFQNTNVTGIGNLDATGTAIMNQGVGDYFGVLRDTDFARFIIGRTADDGWDLQDNGQSLLIRQVVSGTPTNWLTAGTDLSATVAGNLGVGGTPSHAIHAQADSTLINIMAERTGAGASRALLQAGNNNVFVGALSSTPLTLGTGGLTAITVGTDRSTVFGGQINVETPGLTPTLKVGNRSGTAVPAILDLHGWTGTSEAQVRLQASGAAGGDFRLLVGGVQQLKVVPGTTTFAGDIISGGNYYRDISTESTIISGGTAINAGANMVAYGQNHATRANDIEFRADGSSVLTYSHVSTAWNFHENSITNSRAVIRGIKDNALFLSGGDASNQSANQILYGSTHQSNANDWVFRVGPEIKFLYDYDAEVFSFYSDLAVSGAQLLASFGTQSEPAIAFSNNTNTGIFAESGSTISFSNNGVRTMSISNSSINLSVLPSCVDDIAAGTAGLVSGDIYSSPTGELRVKL